MTKHNTLSHAVYFLLNLSWRSSCIFFRLATRLFGRSRPTRWAVWHVLREASTIAQWPIVRRYPAR